MNGSRCCFRRLAGFQDTLVPVSMQVYTKMKLRIMKACPASQFYEFLLFPVSGLCVLMCAQVH